MYTLITPKLYYIHDRPIEGSPLHRLQREGGEVLALSELLQIALGQDKQLEKIAHEYGSHYLANLHTVDEIKDSLLLEHVQAAKLLAILAIGKRLYAPESGTLLHVRGIEDIYHHYRSMAHLAKEQLRVLLINSRYQLVHEETVAIGNTESLNISAKDVFQSAVERRVAAVLLVHNHPSGDPAPSQTDYMFTADMKNAAQLLGIELLDHVIIAQNGYSSCL